ncbi:ferredoxin [Nocardioides humi]|uniref:Ferredoxin n=1 Tax=Nocardioides humi TaxID=449461 RepID=A0ABN2AFI9_9ACTN|nr:ferredoxin [Nocardioides humi]
MQVQADVERCQGHGRCALLAPDVFDVDDLGKVLVLRKEVGDELAGDVDEAVTSCPEAALGVSRG